MADPNFDGNISVRLIENGLLVKTGPGWLFFLTWEKASEHIEKRLQALEKERELARAASARGAKAAG